MRKRLIIPAVLAAVASIGGNIFASTLDATFHLSRPERLLIEAGVLLAVIVVAALLEGGVKIPGYFAYHRWCYLSDLRQSEVLRQWATRFATLQLGRGPRYVAAAEVLEQGARRDLVGVMMKVLTEPRAKGRRVLILGEPGSGKSTALERLTHDLAAYSQSRFGLRGPIPILVRAGGQRADDSLESLIVDAIKNWSRGKTRKLLSEPDSVQWLLEDRRIVLLVDALDELTGGRRDSMLGALSSLATSGGLEHVSVIVTCRTRQDPQHALPDYENYTILELSEDSVAAFINIYRPANGERLQDIHRRLWESGFLDPGGLARNPFWLKQLIAIGIRESTRSGILRIATKESLARELSKPQTALRDWIRPPRYSNEQIIDLCTRALAKLAREMDLRRTIPRHSAKAQLTAWLNDASEAPADLGLSVDHIIGLGVDAGLLERVSDPISFGHRLLQEYFTALALLGTPESPTAWLPRFVSDATSWQTLALFGGLQSEDGTDPFVETVLGDEPDARHLACAIAIYVGDNRAPAGPMTLRLLEQIRAALARGDSTERELQDSLREFLVMGHDLAAAFLGRLLADRDAKVRLRVCELLALSNSRTAAGLLASAGLDDEGDDVAAAASAALAKMGEFGFCQTLRRLESDKSRTRRWAARTLAKIGDPDALNYLLLLDRGTDTGGTGVGGKDNFRTYYDVYNPRYDVTQLPQADEEAAIEEAITTCGHGHVGSLLMALAFSTGRRRLRIVKALRFVPDPRAVRVLKRLVRDSDGDVREAALEGLKADAQKRKGGGAKEDLLSGLVAALASEDEAVGQWAAQALAELDGAEGVKRLLDAIEGGFAVASGGLVFARSPEALRLLVEVLADAAAPLRVHLVTALVDNSSADVEPVLLEAAASADARRRSAAILCLADRQLQYSPYNYPFSRALPAVAPDPKDVLSPESVAAIFRLHEDAPGASQPAGEPPQGGTA